MWLFPTSLNYPFFEFTLSSIFMYKIATFHFLVFQTDRLDDSETEIRPFNIKSTLSQNCI